MTIKTSTGLRNKMLDTGPVRTLLNLGSVKIYSGAVPASADESIGAAVLLTTLTNASTATGLTLAPTAASGIIAKTVGEVWSGVNGAGGVASFYRHVAVGDTGALSTTEARIQGDIGLAGADMNMTNTTLSNGATQTLDFYIISLPTA